MSVAGDHSWSVSSEVVQEQTPTSASRFLFHFGVCCGHWLDGPTSPPPTIGSTTCPSTTPGKWQCPTQLHLIAKEHPQCTCVIIEIFFLYFGSLKRRSAFHFWAAALRLSPPEFVSIFFKWNLHPQSCYTPDPWDMSQYTVPAFVPAHRTYSAPLSLAPPRRGKCFLSSAAAIQTTRPDSSHHPVALMCPHCLPLLSRPLPPTTLSHPNLSLQRHAVSRPMRSHTGSAVDNSVHRVPCRV